MQSATCRSTAALAGAVAVLFAGAAGAQRASDTPAEPGAAGKLYVGLAYGQATARKACDDVAGCDKRDNSFGAFAGKLGLARGAQEGGGALSAAKELSTSLTYGLGVQMDFPRRLGLRAEWQRYPRLGGGPVLPTGDIDELRLAAPWRFR